MMFIFKEISLKLIYPFLAASSVMGGALVTVSDRGGGDVLILGEKGASLN